LDLDKYNAQSWLTDDMSLWEYSGQPWLNGTLNITDDKTLWDVIQDVIRTELYWNYLRDLEIWKRLELMNLALDEASKFINGKENV
jgi:hypothetical protein